MEAGTRSGGGGGEEGGVEEEGGGVFVLSASVDSPQMGAKLHYY